MFKKQTGVVKQRHNIAYDPTVPTMYGGPAVLCCPPLFDLGCSDGSIGIFCSGGEFEMAMRWFGFRRARARREEVDYLKFTGGVKRTSGDTDLPGVPEAICSPGDGTAWGKECKDVKDCFGLLKLIGDPVVDGGNSLPYCQQDPRVFVDGTEIVDDEAWHMFNLSETIWNTWVYNLLWGVKDNAANKMGHYGLWSLFNAYGDTRDYTYPCPELTPHILDWNSHIACDATAMAGITLDGQALAAEFRTNLYFTLRAILRAMKRQISRTRGLGNSAWRYGDWAILGPSEMFDCLIQCATCFTECAGNCLNLDTERAALKLQELRNGGEGWGELDFDGFKIPLIPFDPSLIQNDGAGVYSELGGLKNSDGTFNFFLVYRGSGNQRVLQPEYNPLDDGSFETSENGLIQWYEDRQDVCVTPGARLEWRWDKRGIWLSTLVRNVTCESILPATLCLNPAGPTNTCTVAPLTAFNTTPAASVPAATPSTFTFFSNDPTATFECSLDAAAYAPCASPVSLTGLSAGSHTFAVRAVTSSGTVDATPASYTWTIT